MLQLYDLMRAKWDDMSDFDVNTRMVTSHC